MKLQKLLYYCQGVHLAYDNKKLFDEKIVAYQYGPVVEEVYHKYKSFKGTPIEYTSDLNYNLDDSEKETIEFAIENFGSYSEWRLVREAHKEDSPWFNANCKKENIFDNVELDISDIKQYFIDNVVEV